MGTIKKKKKKRITTLTQISYDKYKKRIGYNQIRKSATSYTIFSGTSFGEKSGGNRIITSS